MIKLFSLFFAKYIPVILLCGCVGFKTGVVYQNSHKDISRNKPLNGAEFQIKVRAAEGGMTGPLEYRFVKILKKTIIESKIFSDFYEGSGKYDLHFEIIVEQEDIYSVFDSILSVLSIGIVLPGRNYTKEYRINFNHKNKAKFVKTYSYEDSNLTIWGGILLFPLMPMYSTDSQETELYESIVRQFLIDYTNDNKG